MNNRNTNSKHADQECRLDQKVNLRDRNLGRECTMTFLSRKAARAVEAHPAVEELQSRESPPKEPQLNLVMPQQMLQQVPETQVSQEPTSEEVVEEGDTIRTVVRYESYGTERGLPMAVALS